MISADLDLESLRRQFESAGKVTVDNFLMPETAMRFRDYYIGLPRTKWEVSHYPRQGPDVLDTPDNQKYVADIGSQMWQWSERGEHARFFKRIKEDRGEIHDEVVGSFSDKIFFSTLSQITGFDLSFTYPAIAYKYDLGCFISRHCDKGDCKATFVYHLSTEWSPEWGGLFLDLSDDSVIVPKFNRLFVFDMRDKRLPHCVTRVNVNRPRLSISSSLK